MGATKETLITRHSVIWLSNLCQSKYSQVVEPPGDRTRPLSITRGVYAPALASLELCLLHFAK